MLAGQQLRLLAPFVWACTLLIASSSVPAEELLSVHLRRVADGEFPVQRWYPEDRRPITEELESMNGLIKALATIDARAMREIERAYADRAVVIRDLDAANLRDRIDEVCDAHQPIIQQLKSVRWANASEDLAPFEFMEQRMQVQSMAYLVTLYSAREFAAGRTDSASQTLAGGYAFAHNLMRTSGDINLIMGIVLESVLSHAIVDLQSSGAPDMRLPLDRLSESQMDQQTLDRLLWNAVCHAMPVLVDRPRKPQEWREDIRATLNIFDREGLTPDSAEEAERLGRQFQTLVLTGKRLKALSFPVKYEHGGLPKLKELKPGQQFRFKTNLNVPTLAEYVEKMLDSTHLDRARNELQQRLCGVQCIEVLRLESVKRGSWLSEIDGTFKNSLPVLQGTNMKPTIIVMQGGELPAYEIKLPRKDLLARFTEPPELAPIVAVSTEQALFE